MQAHAEIKIAAKNFFMPHKNNNVLKITGALVIWRRFMESLRSHPAFMIFSAGYFT
jgi:hypothetical protein